jgi:hypothetical protein
MLLQNMEVECLAKVWSTVSCLPFVSCELFYHTSMKRKRTWRYFGLCVSFVIRVSLTLETGNRELTFLYISRDFRERVAFCASVLVRAACKWKWVWSIGDVILNGENRSAWINTYHSATLSSTKFTSIDLGWNSEPGALNVWAVARPHNSPKLTIIVLVPTAQ